MVIHKKPSSCSRTPRRAYYPSGPWIDGIRPAESYAAPAPDPRNPDPGNYKVILVEEHGNYLIVKLNYPNCTNFEGNKILVFSGVKLIDLMNQRLIDPHFFQDKKFASPVARFIPTPEGLNMARKFVVAMGVTG